MKKIKLLVSFCIILFTVRAHATLEIVIRDISNTARPIAVVPFQWTGTGVMPESLSKVISDD